MIRGAGVFVVNPSPARQSLHADAPYSSTVCSQQSLFTMENHYTRYSDASNSPSNNFDESYSDQIGIITHRQSKPGLKKIISSAHLPDESMVPRLKVSCRA